MRQKKNKIECVRVQPRDSVIAVYLWLPLLRVHVRSFASAWSAINCHTFETAGNLAATCKHASAPYASLCTVPLSVTCPESNSDLARNDSNSTE